MKVQVVIHEEEGGGFSAAVPALPGCYTCGDTREELLANIREAIEAMLLGPDPALVGPERLPPTDGGRLEEVEV